MSYVNNSVHADFGQARASFAYIFKIEVDGELFFVGNEHPDNWRYQPVGGGYHYFDQSKDAIEKYFAPKAAPSVHGTLNGWLRHNDHNDFKELSIPGGRGSNDVLINESAPSQVVDDNDFRFLIPAAKMRQLFEFFCSTEHSDLYVDDCRNCCYKNNIEQRMSEACEMNDMFTDLVYKTGQLALEKGWAQERGLNGAGQVMAYLKTQNNLYAGLPDLVCHREQINDLSREFKEELFDSGIIPQDKHQSFKTISYDYLGYYREFFYDERFGCYSFFVSDVVNLNLTDEQREVFRWLRAQNNHNYCFIKEQDVPEHILYRTDSIDSVPAPPIADHSQKVLSSFLAKTSYYKRTAQRTFTVKLF